MTNGIYYSFLYCKKRKEKRREDERKKKRELYTIANSW
jgi:hypothetical protein